MSIAPVLRVFLPATAALTLLVSASAQTAQEASATRSARGIVVGVVDVIKVVEQYPRYIKLRSELEASIQQYEAQLQDMAGRADELRGTAMRFRERADELDAALRSAA